MFYGSGHGTGRCSSAQGYHCDPYEPQLLFYDPEELAEVSRNERQPYEVLPYAEFNPEPYLWPGSCRTKLSATAFDRENGIFYLIQAEAYGNDAALIVHVFQVATDGPDTELPSTPVLQKVLSSDQQGFVGVFWEPSTDNNAVDGYDVFRSSSASGPFEKIGEANYFIYIDEDVSNGSTYHYQVSARDEAGNVSPRSSTMSATYSDAENQPPAVSLAILDGATELEKVIEVEAVDERHGISSCFVVTQDSASILDCEPSLRHTFSSPGDLYSPGLCNRCSRCFGNR